MDLGQFATQDNSDAGVWTPVELYGKPCDFDILILGDDADVVVKQGRKSLKKLKSAIAEDKKTNSDEYDDQTIDELTESGNESVLIRINGIRGWKVERKGSKVISKEPEPVTLCGEELKNDIESYRKLITKIPALKEFILKVSRDRTNFLSEPSRS